MRVTPEKAQEIIRRYDSSGLEILDRERYEATRDDILPKYYAENFYLKILNSDELPKDHVGPEHPDFPFMKCRGNFIEGLVADFKNAIDDRVILDRDIVYFIQDFLEYPWEYGLRFTNRDEIKKINATLSIVLNYLVKTYNLTLDRPALQEKFKQLKHKARAKWGVE